MYVISYKKKMKNSHTLYNFSKCLIQSFINYNICEYVTKESANNDNKHVMEDNKQSLNLKALLRCVV